MNLNSGAGLLKGLPTNIPYDDYIQKPVMLQSFEKMKKYKESNGNVVPYVYRKYQKMFSIQETCVKLLSQDVARVSIMFESDYYVLTNTNVRVTFFDQISALGKILIK